MSIETTATLTLVEELDFAIDALREDGGVELVAANAEELIASVDDPDITAQHLREVARIHDRRAEASNAPADWSEMSHYAKLMNLTRYCDNDVRAKLEEVADELRINSMADAEMEAYCVGNISRGTLVERLEELAGTDAGILQFLRAHERYGRAWHDDSVEIY